MKAALAAVALLASCANPPPARTFGSMLGAQPACVLICVVNQDITMDNAPAEPPAGAAMMAVEPVLPNK